MVQTCVIFWLRPFLALLGLGAYPVTKRRVVGPAACCSKVNKQARLVERKVCFISDASNWGSAREQTSVQRQLATCGARAFIDWRKGLHVDPAQSALIVIFKLVVGSLTSVILMVGGTVKLQSQGSFVPVFLRPVLRIVAAHVLGTVGSSRS